MSEATETVEVTEQPVQTTTPATKPEVKSEPKGADKTSYLEEKIESLTKALNSTRAENKGLKAERDEFAGKVATFELKTKKSEALDAAMAGLGEDFEVPADKMPRVKELLAEIPDSETLGEKVAGFLELVKAPKSKPGPIMSPYAGTGQQHAPGQSWQPGQKLTPFELGQLSPEQHAAYIRSSQGR